jgi:predicted phosphoribosyltransferase
VFEEQGDLRDRTRVFRDRAHAGAVLSAMLEPHYRHRAGGLVLAIPAGGVPVAAPIAERLCLPLDAAVVSKITPLGNSELGYGAVAFDGSVLLNEGLVRRLGLGEGEVAEGVARTRAKVERRNADLRQGRSYDVLAGAAVILVDDGLASGFTMRAGIAAVCAAGAASITLAVPTAHESSVPAVLGLVDAAYCANVRGGPRFAVADAYMTWVDVDEDTARAVLASVSRPKCGPSPDGVDAA